jgi:hypothetical protein
VFEVEVLGAGGDGGAVQEAGVKDGAGLLLSRLFLSSRTFLVDCISKPYLLYPPTIPLTNPHTNPFTTYPLLRLSSSSLPTPFLEIPPHALSFSPLRGVQASV